MSETARVEGSQAHTRRQEGEHALRWPVLVLLRPHQWIKNGFVLAPLVFAGAFLTPAAVLDAVAAAVVFCLAASAVYVWNDLQDVEADRRHPIKQHTRPIAAGAVSTEQAYSVLVGLLALVGLAWFVDPLVLVPIGAYLAINLGYSLGLKHVPVVDLFCVASGFVLRVYAGALAIAVPVSPWMLVTTLCLALYLAATKRRQEHAANGSDARPVLEAYTQDLLDRYTHITALGAIVFYGIYAATVRPELAMTIPLVLFGFFRYAYLVEADGQGEAPTDVLLRDRPMALVVTVWMGLSVLALWPA